MKNSPHHLERPDARGSTNGTYKVAGDFEKSTRLIDIYNSYFEVIAAETDEQRAAAFRLRYEVYCVEHPYEDPAQNPGGLETDIYDAASLHSLLVHRASGAVAGTVRLILPRHNGTDVVLPMRAVCQHELLACDNDRLPREKTAEISRFAVSKAFRRRASDDVTSVGDFTNRGDDPRRHLANLSLGLMQAIVAMAGQAGITHLCAVLEPTLLRMLRPLGIHFIPLGPPVTYHGRRQPCYSNLDAQLARIWTERPDVWELVTDEGGLWPLNRELAETLKYVDYTDIGT
jgi:N-acyl amino acid synthase of PEP-CTERM/exosortase system